MAERVLMLRDEVATLAAGRALAPALRAGDLVALEGGLGAGKTTFARGLLAGLGLAGEAPSPSFAIVLPYEVSELRLPVWHVDLYRLENSAEADELGLEDALKEGVLLVEWAERLWPTLPADALRLVFEPDPVGGRRLTCHIPAAWRGRWPLP